MPKSEEVMEIEKRTREAVEDYVKAWATNNRELLLQVFSEDAVWFDPVGTPAWEGRAKIGEFWDQARAGGSELEPQVRRIVVCGNEAILLFKMVVRHKNGGGMTLEICDHMTVNEEGQIVLAKAFWDESCMGALDG
jgi:steroid delta-isomerase